jgi:hypothetical protein
MSDKHKFELVFELTNAQVEKLGAVGGDFTIVYERAYDWFNDAERQLMDYMGLASEENE